MKIAVLLNGVSLPHHVIDSAIHWAVCNGGSIHAIFLYNSTSKNPYHGWPANKAITKFMSGEMFAEGNLIELIDRHIKYMISSSALSGVVCEVDVLKNASLEDINLKVRRAAKIFADEETFMRPQDFAYTSISSSQLDIQYKDKIKWCRRNTLKVNN